MSSQNKRIVSGMRPTGKLHLGHYHGVIKNWLTLQHEYEMYLPIVDLHALTTHYDSPQDMEKNVWEMAIDWLACGINPGNVCMFIQSRVVEHAELHLLLSMITPLGWLERVPTYKDQQQKLKEKDLSTYGFLGYPLLQAADILLYKATHVPVGEDQVSHIEMSREVARRFNHIYGKDQDFDEKVEAAIKKLGKKNAKLYNQLSKQYQEKGDVESLETGQALLESAASLSLAERERLLGNLEGGGQIILPEPQALLTQNSKLPGIDGQKMSKSYNNTIGLREDPESIRDKVLKMPTDPARVRRTDPGTPEKCPVWSFHEVYSDEERKAWVRQGCTSASIGCIDCKKPVVEAILQEQEPILERAVEFENNPGLVKGIIAEGCDKAREQANETMQDVREVMCLDYR